MTKHLENGSSSGKSDVAALNLIKCSNAHIILCWVMLPVCIRRYSWKMNIRQTDFSTPFLF